MKILNSSDSTDDLTDFLEAAKDYDPKNLDSRNAEPPSGLYKDEDDEGAVIPGKVNQYSLYGPGYASTTSTIPKLAAGCYEITCDSKRSYVVPMAKPTGLLLELPEMRSDHVVELIESFWNSEKDYKEGNEFVIGGAAYRAGVMLYGPPGSGKSSTIKIVANRLTERGGIVFYASINPASTMEFLNDFSAIEKNRKCIVILEDIDSLIHNYGESGYLEMLDSAKTIDNVLFIATTNYPDRLDPRIYNRPGRFSHVVKIGLPTAPAREAFLKAILKNHRDVKYIVENTKNFTIDHLSSLISAVYREKKDLGKEIERLRTLFKVPKADDGRGIGIGANMDDEK